MNIKVIGSGNNMNKYLKVPSLKQSKMRNLINYKSRDWEMWINLKDNLLDNVSPTIDKRKMFDNSFVITVSINKAYLDHTTHYNIQVPTLLINKTADYYYYDMYRTKIPKNPVYIHRKISSIKPGANLNEDKFKMDYEVMTVHSEVKFNLIIRICTQILLP